MESSRNYFTYESLRECRLFELQPDPDSSAAIKARVYNINLSRNGTWPGNQRYETLSYVRGDPRDTAQMLLQGRYSQDYVPFKITKNLDLALRHLRFANKPRTLWVDAVCIDQKNVLERAQQVTLMSNIYQDAERNLLWLGEEDSASADIFDLLERLEDVTFDSPSRDRHETMSQAYSRTGISEDYTVKFESQAMISGFSKETWQSF